MPIHARSRLPHQETTVQSRNRITLFIIIVFLYWAALYLYAPTLPVYAQTKTNNLALVGVVISMYGLWQAIVRLPIGIVSDWLGRRKPFILVGFVLVGSGAWMMGRAGDISDLIIGRAITGLAAGTWVPLVVAFNSLYPAEDGIKATSIMTLVGSISRLLVTSVTGSLNDLGGYPLAFFLAAGTAVLAILILLPYKEMRRPTQAPTLRGIINLSTRRDVMVPSLLNFITQYVVMATTFGFIPILANKLGATNVIQSVMVTTNLALLILGNLLIAPITKRVNQQNIIIASFILMSMGIATVAMANSLGIIFLSQVLLGLSGGISYPLLMGMSIERVADRERSTVMGLHQAIYGVGLFAGPWLSGIIANVIGIQSMFGLTSLACLVIGVLGARAIALPSLFSAKPGSPGGDGDGLRNG